ncbi:MULTISPECIES: sugar efflux transporter [Paenibacillus]|uniref:sugar efflux transporter n=1 Tax=Paenibacillus TaxID=44249 RepID=UPI0025595386|nr:MULTISPECIES: sugar efflux transporter [Paenibacillus]
MQPIITTSVNKSRSYLSLIFSVKQFVILLFINFMIGLSVSFYVPFNSLFSLEEVGMSNLSFGYYMVIGSLSSVLISSIIGSRSDSSTSRKKLLMLAFLFSTIGFIIFAFSRNYYVLLLNSAVIMGVASCGTPQIYAYAKEVLENNSVDQNKIPFLINIFRMSYALSWTCGPALAALLLVKFDFKGVFLIVALLYFLTLIIIMLFLKQSKLVVSKKARTKVLPLIFGNKKILLTFIAFMFITAAGYINTMNMSQYVIKSLNGSESQVGIIFSVPPLFEIPFMVYFGLLAIKNNVVKLIKIGMIIAVIYYMLLIFVTDVWNIYPIQILSAAYISIIMGVSISYFQGLIPDEPGTTSTLYTNATRLGSLVGYLLFGLITQFLDYRNAYICCVILAALSLVLIYSSNFKKESVRL